MRVLVTGNLGYIGPRLVARLTADGAECIGLDAGWFADAYAEAVNPPPIQHEADIRDLVGSPKGQARLRTILEGVDAVVHLAAVSNDPVADLLPTISHEINFEASARFAEVARDAGIRRFIFNSTCSVYGDADGEVDEETPPRILTPYADSKVRLERTLQGLASSTFWPVIFRSATVYGYSPALRLDLVVNGMTAWAITTGIVRLISTGDAYRPQVHLDDLVGLTARVLSFDDAAFAALAGQPINVGANHANYLLGDLAQIVADRIPGARVHVDEGAWVDRRSYRVRFDRLHELIPDVAIRSVDEAIESLARDYRRVGLAESDVRSLRFTRLEQLRLAQLRGILDPQLRFASAGPVRGSAVAG